MLNPTPGPGFWYMAGPYSDAPQERFEEHLSAMAHLYRARLTIYSPVVNCHWLAVLHKLPGDAPFWEHHDFNMIERSNGLIILQLNGWKKSSGVKAEISHARVINRPIWGLEPPDNLTFTWTRLI